MWQLSKQSWQNWWRKGGKKCKNKSMNQDVTEPHWEIWDFHLIIKHFFILSKLVWKIQSCLKHLWVPASWWVWWIQKNPLNCFIVTESRKVIRVRPPPGHILPLLRDEGHKTNHVWESTMLSCSLWFKDWKTKNILGSNVSVYLQLLRIYSA